MSVYIKICSCFYILGRVSLTSCLVNILLFLQFPYGVSAVLCHYHATQPVTAPGGSQDGGAFGRWTAKDGPPSKKDQPKIPGHHHRLPAAALLRQSGEQGVCMCLHDSSPCGNTENALP